MIALLLLASTTPAFVTGDRLLKLCEADAPACVAYLEGVSDTTDVLQSIKAMPRRYCPPEKITADKVQSIVLKALRDDDASLSDGGAGLAWSALIRAYPCKANAAETKKAEKDKAEAKDKPKARSAAKPKPKKHK